LPALLMRMPLAVKRSRSPEHLFRKESCQLGCQKRPSAFKGKPSGGRHGVLAFINEHPIWRNLVSRSNTFSSSASSPAITVQAWLSL
jgi:hypothetical protein